ncbi:deoxyribose-phosphate aldolase [Pseudidiomarina homiensis]|uniref:Deoxyribose-phosphate aldolase n=1 Tax=Pseudidiomarina homiensis TaxID=364198 RepID=A0A432XSU7_9GAMM|nr:deoxyribose-phosphate aldolase [Pseudidiomarina homiensis]RUO51797.1 deoxyribose-phosphate aldolase [Pseudidiomarina homiensis]
MSRSERDVAQLVLRLMDLTSLNQSDSPAAITELCTSAASSYGSPAALCVFPEFVVWAKHECERLNLTQVKIATVTNFPMGSIDVARAVAETERAVGAGADEVDVVFPYQALTAGDEKVGYDMVQACKQACAERALLKVILETGELQTPQLIRRASEIAIQAGADFIKTSTGKVAVNATPEAAKMMLEAIRESGTQCGFKAAGGVRTAADAAVYLDLAQQIMGSSFLSPERFRFGASGLLTNLHAILAGQSPASAGTSY